jgi:carnitine-CoA ligase
MAPEIARALHGPGADLGPYATRFPLEERTVLHVLRYQAQERPDKTWLVFDGQERLTFAQAYRLTNQVADAVRTTVGPGKHLGLMLRNQLEFLPAEMGILAAPGVAVPINSELRGPLLQSVVERSDISALIVRQDLLERVEDLGALGKLELIVVIGQHRKYGRVHDVPVVSWGTWLSGKSPEPGAPLPNYDDTAVIAFTSGTTGRAKGVVHSHHYWQLFSALLTDSLNRTPDDVLTTPLPLHHGGAMHVVANSALHAGCTATFQSRFSATRFWDEAARDRATYAFLLGPIAALIQKACSSAPDHRVETVYCVPPPPDWEQFEQQFHTRLLWQGWAMTEILPLPMQTNQLKDVPSDTIGYPPAWIDYGVVDEHDNMVAPGETGQLVWRSLIPYGMFNEYYRDPDITVRAFRNHWFHTGDAASYDADGMLHFRGRMNDRIRRRGELVNAAEVEYVVQRHPSIIDAAVYGVQSDFGEDDIKVDVILATTLTADELHAWLTRNLPKFMVPRYIEFVPEFPRTPSGRIEKYKLKSASVSRPDVFDADGYQ